MENSKAKNFYDWKVWQDAHSLTLSIYKFTKTFPTEEQYGLISQIRRAASSVGANIAEGFGRHHFKDKNKFYLNSRGSLTELQNHILLAKDLGYLSLKDAEMLFKQSEEINRQLNGLIKNTVKLSNF